MDACYFLKKGFFDKSVALYIGDKLRIAREGAGIPLSSVAAELRIRSCYLHALEKGEAGELPGETYYSGFLSSYANFLKIPIDNIVETYEAEQQEVASAEEDLPIDGHQGFVEPDQAVEMTDSVRNVAMQAYQSEPQPEFQYNSKDITAYLCGLPKISYCMMGGFVLVLVWLLWQIINGAFSVEYATETTQTENEQVTEEFSTSRLRDVAGNDISNDMSTGDYFTATSADRNDGILSAHKGEFSSPVKEISDFAVLSEKKVELPKTLLPVSNILIKARQASWIGIIELSDSHQEGKLIFSAVLRSGETYHVPKHQRLIMKTGNADALDILLYDELFLVRGFSGITGYLFLDEVKIKEGTAVVDALDIVRSLPKNSFFAFSKTN